MPTYDTPGTVRVSPRAIIRRGERYLVSCYLDELGEWCVFPGGGQKHGEDLHQTLAREVEEETGAVPVIGAVRFVRECIAARYPSHNLPSDMHQVEIFFECELRGEAVFLGHEPDPGQIGVAWRTIAELRQLRFYPPALLDCLTDPTARYLGAC